MDVSDKYEDPVAVCALCSWTASMKGGAKDAINAAAFLRSRLLDHLAEMHPDVKNITDVPAGQITHKHK